MKISVETPEMPPRLPRPTPQPPILLRENVGTIACSPSTGRRAQPVGGLIAGLHGALKEIHDDNSVRAVVIAANGPAFSAGHDMKELTARRTMPIAAAPISGRS
jgi:hypothetical protein